MIIDNFKLTNVTYTIKEIFDSTKFIELLSLSERIRCESDSGNYGVDCELTLDSLLIHFEFICQCKMLIEAVPPSKSLLGIVTIVDSIHSKFFIHGRFVP